MRRPLFGDGQPRNVLNADGELTVFSTSLNDKDVWAITLYAWWHEDDAVPANPPGIVARVDNNGVTTTTGLVAVLPAAYWTARSAAQSPDWAPVKILDRLPLRGAQVLKIGNQVGANTECWVWGYAERVGASPLGTPFRPLQPTDPVPPSFNGDPIPNLAGDGDTETVVIHQLSDTYIDLLSLHVGVLGDEDALARVVFPNGATLKIPVVTVTMPMLHILDGIPMRATADDATDITTVATGDGGKAVLVTAHGPFLRAG